MVDVIRRPYGLTPVSRSSTKFGAAGFLVDSRGTDAPIAFRRVNSSHRGWTHVATPRPARWTIDATLRRDEFGRTPVASCPDQRLQDAPCDLQVMDLAAETIVGVEEFVEEVG